MSVRQYQGFNGDELHAGIPLPGCPPRFGALIDLDKRSSAGSNARPRPTASVNRLLWGGVTLVGAASLLGRRNDPDQRRFNYVFPNRRDVDLHANR